MYEGIYSPTISLDDISDIVEVQSPIYVLGVPWSSYDVNSSWNSRSLSRFRRYYKYSWTCFSIAYDKRRLMIFIVFSCFIKKVNWVIVRKCRDVDFWVTIVVVIDCIHRDWFMIAIVGST